MESAPGEMQSLHPSLLTMSYQMKSHNITVLLADPNL